MLEEIKFSENSKEIGLEKYAGKKYVGVYFTKKDAEDYIRFRLGEDYSSSEISLINIEYNLNNPEEDKRICFDFIVS